jgi:hypothetical protein
VKLPHRQTNKNRNKARLMSQSNGSTFHKAVLTAFLSAWLPGTKIRFLRVIIGSWIAKTTAHKRLRRKKCSMTPSGNRLFVLRWNSSTSKTVTWKNRQWTTRKTPLQMARQLCFRVCADSVVCKDLQCFRTMTWHLL